MNDVATNPAMTLRKQLEQRLDEFQKILPKHITADQFVGTIIRATMANNDLVKADRISLFESALAAASDGLMPDGKEGAMVIYNTKMKIDGKEEWVKKVQWLPMIRGIFTKLYNTGLVRSCSVGVVYAGDTFRAWTDETGEHLFHEEGETQDRTKVLRYYAMVLMKDGGVFVETMRLVDIEKIRNASKAKDSGPWVTWFDEMAKKSVFKRLAKRLPLSREIAQVLSRDDFLYDANSLRDVTPAADRPRGLTNRLNALADMSGVGTVPADLTEGDRQPVEDSRTEQRQQGKERRQEREREKPAATPETARASGRDAAEKGMSRKAIPAEYRQNEQLVDAWLDGFDGK